MTTERDRQLCRLALRHAFLNHTEAEWYLRNYGDVGEDEGFGKFLVAERVIAREQLAVLENEMNGGAPRGPGSPPPPGELAQTGVENPFIWRARVEDALEQAAARRTEPLRVDQPQRTSPVRVLLASVFVVVALLFAVRMLLDVEPEDTREFRKLSHSNVRVQLPRFPGTMTRTEYSARVDTPDQRTGLMVQLDLTVDIEDDRWRSTQIEEVREIFRDEGHVEVETRELEIHGHTAVAFILTASDAGNTTVTWYCPHRKLTATAYYVCRERDSSFIIERLARTARCHE